jgi:serine/threonine protein kinase
VTRQVYELEEAEWKAVLADLGEGKRLTGPNKHSQTALLRDYGHIDYRPPEVIKDRRAYTTKADVYSFGVLGARLMEYCRDTGEMPTRLHELLRDCCNQDSAKRPDADVVAHLLDEIKPNANCEWEPFTALEFPFVDNEDLDNDSDSSDSTER